MPAHLFHKHQKVQNHAAHLVFKTKLDHVTSHPLFSALAACSCSH